MTEPSAASKCGGRRGAGARRPDLTFHGQAAPVTPFDKAKVVAENRRARYDYFVEERFETGIELRGTEVKALRGGEGSIAESYAAIEGEEVWLINSLDPRI